MHRFLSRIQEKHMPWTDDNFDSTGGTSVGSANSQDLFAGYGTEFNNPDRFILDISDRIHMLGADQSKFVSWIMASGKQKTNQIQFTHMESELFTIRNFEAVIERSADSADYVWTLKLKPQDWQGIETAALGDASTEHKPMIYLEIKVTGDDNDIVFHCTPEKYALNGASNRYIFAQDGGTGNAQGNVKDRIVLGSWNGAAVATGTSVDWTGHSAEISNLHADTTPITGETLSDFDDTAPNTEFDGAATYDCTVEVVTPQAQLQGFPQGSGLPMENRKFSRSLTNYVQIFKTPLSISNTLKAVSMRGGNELAMLRFRKAIEHKTEIELAMIFQGGGTEGTDYGILATGDENPLTRFKGFGVGHTDGFVVTKNADNDSAFVIGEAAMIAAGPTYIHTLLENIFDDLVDDPSETKTMFCGNPWLKLLANAASTFSSGGFSFGDHTVKNELGISNVRVLTSPFGTLNVVPYKHFRGKWKEYAIVADMKNIKIRPLRDTVFISDAENNAVDGQVDYFISELGMQMSHESTHCILKRTA